MDAFLLKQIVAELSGELRGALVSKVHQPAEKEIVLTLWTGREEKRLLLSADPEACRIHLSTRKVPNPPSPPRFCQFLRRHLEGMRIEGLSVAPFDRLVRMESIAKRPDALHRRTFMRQSGNSYGGTKRATFPRGSARFLPERSGSSRFLAPPRASRDLLRSTAPTRRRTPTIRKRRRPGNWRSFGSSSARAHPPC